MMVGRIPGFTRMVGKSQGYHGLPVLDEVIIDVAAGRKAPSMTTSWEPTPGELEALNAGASVHVRILGNQHPPIDVSVGSPPLAS